MIVKHDRNWVGSLMFFIFVLGTALKVGLDAFVAMIKHRDVYESILVLPVGLGLFGYLAWVLIDSSWLNFDDDEKETVWKTSRWVKFSPLFLLPIVKFFSTPSQDPVEMSIELAKWMQTLLVVIMGYFSLCFPYGSGLGRLFQPFTVPRSKVYADEKGQKFEVNFIGTAASIFLIILPSWLSMPENMGRVYLYLAGKTLPTVASSTALSNTAEGRLIADVVVLVFILYSFGIMFMSCVKVTFFLKSETLNYLRFAPVPLTPLAILFTDQLCTYGVQKYSVQNWVTILCYVVINFAAYVSLVSPPDSLTAVFFQPHVPMISTVTDLPDMKEAAAREKPHSTAVFPEPQTESK